MKKNTTPPSMEWEEDDRFGKIVNDMFLAFPADKEDWNRIIAPHLRKIYALLQEKDAEIAKTKASPLNNSNEALTNKEKL